MDTPIKVGDVVCLSRVAHKDFVGGVGFVTRTVKARGGEARVMLTDGRLYWATLKNMDKGNAYYAATAGPDNHPVILAVDSIVGLSAELLNGAVVYSLPCASRAEAQAARQEKPMPIKPLADKKKAKK